MFELICASLGCHIQLAQAVITNSGMFIFFSILRGEKFTYLALNNWMHLSSFIWNVEKCLLFRKAITWCFFYDWIVM